MPPSNDPANARRLEDGVPVWLLLPVALEDGVPVWLLLPVALEESLVWLLLPVAWWARSMV